MNVFAALGVNETLTKLLKTQGIKTPTPIQMSAIPNAFKGRDLPFADRDREDAGLSAAGHSARRNRQSHDTGAYHDTDPRACQAGL